jgi:hypothetical protein
MTSQPLSSTTTTMDDEFEERKRKAAEWETKLMGKKIVDQPGDASVRTPAVSHRKSGLGSVEG